MSQAQNIIEASVAANQEELIDVSRQIWNYAELGFEEFQSAELLCKTLEKHGFTVTRNLAGIPNAFKAVWGSGKPVIGLLGEFDALPGLSQKAGCPVHDPLVEGAPGHGCGHNLLGTGAMGGAFALKDYLEKTGTPGTIIYFGTPAEENFSGKAFMAREHCFDGVDLVLGWHPAPVNSTYMTHSNANVCRSYVFKGVTAHAGGSPHLGRSALDSCEIMSVGVNYLREHIIMEARVHYAYVDAGGRAPNVVQDHAKVRYLIRAPYYRQVKEIVPRVDDIARGAALICGTQVEIVPEGGSSEYISNTVLAQNTTEAFHMIGTPHWEDADFALAKSFTESFTEVQKAQQKQQIIKLYGEDHLAEKLAYPLDTRISDNDPNHEILGFGSTDVGDVGFICPTFHFNVATEALGTPGHSWYKTGQVATAIGQKGMLTASKVMALSAALMVEHPDRIEEAKKEFMAKNNGQYDCPVADVKEIPKF